MATRSDRGSAGTSARSTVAIFALAGLASMIIVALGMVLVARSNARHEAVRDARDVTIATGRAAVGPLMTEDFLRGDPVAVAEVDRTVRSFVLSDRVVRTKIWSSDGKVLYSDNAALIGQTYPISQEDLQAFTGPPQAEISDLSDPEQAGERQFGKLLEVYSGLRSTTGTPVLFEAYLDYGAVEQSSSEIIRDIAPPIFGGVALLFLIQLPLAAALTRRLSQHQQERELLLRRTLEAGDEERRRIAADLHDSIVQSLAGTSYSLSAAADNAERAGLASVASTLTNAATNLRQGVRELRTLIVAIAPPRLEQEGLEHALSDAASPLEGQGTAVDIHVNAPRNLSRNAEAFVYRAAREALRNVVKHANATRVTVEVAPLGSDRVQCVVKDNGRGFTPDEGRRRREEGHVGLRLLEELAEQAGGSLKVMSAPGAGTEVVLEVPVQ